MGDPLVLPAFNIINSCVGMLCTMFMILAIYYRYVRARTERAPSKSLTKCSVYARTSLATLTIRAIFP
jgi:hypothetical protein